MMAHGYQVARARFGRARPDGTEPSSASAFRTVKEKPEAFYAANLCRDQNRRRDRRALRAGEGGEWRRRRCEGG
jgi:hypothetical protein